MRISKSACTLAKKKYYNDRTVLELARTNVFTEENLDLDGKSNLGVLKVKRSKLISRTKLVNAAVFSK